MTTIADCLAAASTLWPTSGAEPWDTPGLTVGGAHWPARRILIAVDAVADTVSEAVDGNYDLLITHHPLLLRGVTSVSTDHYKGELLTRLIQSTCGLLVAHTNADVVDSGATSILAQRLGIQHATVISPTSAANIGIGRVGMLPAPVTLGGLARQLASVLPATAGGVRAAGDWSDEVQRVALCSGAGDSLLQHPDVRSADVFITSDLRHHPAQESREHTRIGTGPALIDVSHWASEWLWCDEAAAQLRAALPGVHIDVSDTRTDPWDFVVFPAERNV